QPPDLLGNLLVEPPGANDPETVQLRAAHAALHRSSEDYATSGRVSIGLTSFLRRLPPEQSEGTGSSREGRRHALRAPRSEGHKPKVYARAPQIAVPSASATVKMSLSPRPHMFITRRWSAGRVGAIFAT